jgi:hypothetical protein
VITKLLNEIKMKNVKLLKASLVIGNVLFILLGILTGIESAIRYDKSLITIAVAGLLCIPLVLLLIYGYRTFKNINDADSYFALLALSFLIISGQFLLIYLIVFDLKHFLKFLPLIIFSTIMLLLWVLNVIAYLKRDK